MLYPNQTTITDLIYQIRQRLFPEHFGEGDSSGEVHKVMKEQIKVSLLYRKKQMPKNIDEESDKITEIFFQKLPVIKNSLRQDAEAGLQGDPAAYSIDEIILVYPGFFAILAYRLAHELSILNVPLIPRMMCEYAHSKTGIDINPSAEIGNRFFIDHGTGVVIGETASIGNNVKIYQGVTIGALSTKNVENLVGKKRHPTIEDDVVIYAGAAILGGNTVIGKGSTIGGNAFITESVSPKSKISAAI